MTSLETSSQPLGDGLLQPTGALTTRYHLACLSGPDQGAVIPLVNASVIGRSTLPSLADRSVSRAHFKVTLAPRKGRIIGSLSRVGGGARQEVRLKVRGTVRMGEGTWRVRERPTNLEWTPPKVARPDMNWMRLLPLVLLLWIAWRSFAGRPQILLGIVAAAGTALIFGRQLFLLKRRRRFDGAHLFLAWHARPRAGPVAANSSAGMTVWAGPWGKEKLEVKSGDTVGVIGENARASALWIGLQLSLQARELPLIQSRDAAAQGPAVFVWPAGLARDGETVPPGSIVIAWAKVLEDLPACANRLVRAEAPVGQSWSPPDAGSTMDEASIPSSLTLEDLGVSTAPQATLQRWRGFKYAWAVPVGMMAAEKIFHIDLPAMGPHALVAGATGSGKTVALQTILWSLVLHAPPTCLRLVLIDYKGGAGLGELAEAVHTETFSSDLDPSFSAWILQRLKQVLQQRKRDLLERGFADIEQWEQAAASGLSSAAPPRLLVVIDEFQVLYEEHPHLLGAFTRLSAQGRSLGFHLILATQRPGHAVNADLRGTVDLRIGLRFTEAADSVATLGHDGGAKLPKIPGRALCGESELQFAQVGAPALPRTVGQPARSWPLPLPPTLEASALRHPHQIGVREGTAEGPSPVPVLWQEHRLLLVGPRGNLAELQARGRLIAENFSHSLDVPLHAVVEAHSPRPRATTTIVSTDARSIALLLHELLRAPPAVVIFENLPATLKEFEYRGLGAEFLAAFAKLTQTCGPGGHRLVAIDAEGSAAGKGFTQILAKVPTRGALIDPSLSRHLPPLNRLIGSADLRGSLTEEEAVSDHLGRFVATGFTETATDGGAALRLAPTVVQLAEPAEEASWHTAGKPLIENWEKVPKKSDHLRFLAGAAMQEIAPPTSDITFLGLPDTLQTDLGRYHPQFRTLPIEQWRLVVTAPGDWIVIDPPLELLRFLSSQHPELGLWLRAAHPFPASCGLASVNSIVEPIRVVIPESGLSTQAEWLAQHLLHQ